MQSDGDEISDFITTRNSLKRWMPMESQDSSVNTETGLRDGWTGFSYRQGKWWDFLFSTPRPERLWGPFNLLSNRYWGKTAGAWRWPLSSIPVPRLRMFGVTPPPPTTSSWSGAYVSIEISLISSLSYVECVLTGEGRPRIEVRQLGKCSTQLTCRGWCRQRRNWIHRVRKSWRKTWFCTSRRLPSKLRLHSNLSAAASSGMSPETRRS
jgi:hypothetical protein